MSISTAGGRVPPVGAMRRAPSYFHPRKHEPGKAITLASRGLKPTIGVTAHINETSSRIEGRRQPGQDDDVVVLSPQQRSRRSNAVADLGHRSMYPLTGRQTPLPASGSNDPVSRERGTTARTSAAVRLSLLSIPRYLPVAQYGSRRDA